MPFSSLKKKHTPSNSAPAIGLASHSQPVNPWSAHAPRLGKSPSPFPRDGHTLSTAATAAGELYLFGGYADYSLRNDLYVFSTRDFSTTLLPTSGAAPSPRCTHGAALTSTHLLVWGGWTNSSDRNEQNPDYDDSLHLLNLVSREWTLVVVNGPRPCGRYQHTVTLVGSNLFAFGGRTKKRCFNDIWALDVNRLNSNPRWELYQPAPGEGNPPPRSGHVSVTTGDRIIVFGGGDYPHRYNDTWSFDISTRKWTELQCTGSIPTPRVGHAAVLVDDVMYVFGGQAIDGTDPDDLTVLNLSTQIWTTFQDVGPSPSGRLHHAMASDGTRVFVLGGMLSTGALVDEAEPIHVLDTKRLDYLKPDSNAVNSSETISQLGQKSSASPLAQGQPQVPTSSSSDAHAANGAPSFQIATPEELDLPPSPRITHERNPSSNNLPSQPSGVNDKPRDIAGHHAKLTAPDISPEKEIARLEDERPVEFERKLSAMLAAQTERDQRMAQLTDGLERKLSAILAAQSERDRRIAQLTDELAQNGALLKQAEANAVEGKKCAGLEQRELQAKLDKLVLSCDHALEQAQSALQATSRIAEANERSQRELAEVRAELEASKSELAAVHLRPKDAESGWAKSKAEADTSGAKTAANLVNADEDGVTRRLMERVRALEAQMASPRVWNEKSFEMMECTNED